MDRALREFRVRGVKTNIPFLENLLSHPTFVSGDATTTFIDNTPELFHFRPRRDRATKILSYLGDVIINGRPEVKGKFDPKRRLPRLPSHPPIPPANASAAGNARPACWRWARRNLPHGRGSRSGSCSPTRRCATRISRCWQRGCARTTCWRSPMRCAHLRRSFFSLEMWGGATFDTAMRFLQEDPWDRLDQLRERVPNILFQMLLRASNAVGYTNYPDNVVREFVKEAVGAWNRHLPHLRFAELDREHEGRDRSRARQDRLAVRSGNLLHGRHPRSARGRNTA